MEQVAEYKGQLGTTEFGNFLIELGTKYNDASTWLWKITT